MHAGKALADMKVYSFTRDTSVDAPKNVHKLVHHPATEKAELFNSLVLVTVPAYSEAYIPKCDKNAVVSDNAQFLYRSVVDLRVSE